MSSCTSSFLSIGPVRFVLHAADAVPVRYEGWAHREFFASSPSDTLRPLLELPVTIVRGSHPCPDDSPLFESGRNWAAWRDGDGWLFCSGIANRRKPHKACLVPHGMDRATLFVDGDPADAPLCYPLDQVLMWGLLGRCGGALLHASTVVRDGVGYVFAGRSGAGKSTLSALCHAEGWEVLNDDRVILHADSTGWNVSGTPWHGSGSFAQNRTVPLHGIYLLQQDTTDRLEPLSARESNLALLDVTAVPWFEEDWSQNALHTLERLTAAIPVHRFRFTRSSAAVRALHVEVA